VLAQQLIFGRAHGITLLMRTCLDAGIEPAAVLAAHDEWAHRYGQRLRQAERELATHYFAADAPRARAEDLVTALGLAQRLSLAHDSEDLAAACKTMPEALLSKRNNLDLQFELFRDEARLSTATKLEAHVEACRQVSSDGATASDAQKTVEDAWAAWRAENGAAVAAAAVRRQHFRGETAEEYEKWRRGVLQAAVKRLAASTSTCAALAEQLRKPEAGLMHVFSSGPEQPPAR
jgi:hypothetical protein